MGTRQPCKIAVVIATRNRVRCLCVAIEKLLWLPENLEIIVVDNCSTDDTVGVVSECFPAVKVIALKENRGAAARNIEVEAVRAKIVAFSDDDSWWHPGSLARAASYFEKYPRLGLVAAKVFVNSETRLDPTCEAMAQSPLMGAPELPGRPVLGFIAYHYPQMTKRPEPGSDSRLNRRQIMVRNALWSTWLRRPWSSAFQQLVQMTPSCFTDAGRRFLNKEN